MTNKATKKDQPEQQPTIAELTATINAIANTSRLASAGQIKVQTQRDTVTAFVMQLAVATWTEIDISEDHDKAILQTFDVLRESSKEIKSTNMQTRKRAEPQYGIVANERMPIGNLLSAWQMACHGLALAVDPTQASAKSDEGDTISYRAWRKLIELAKDEYRREQMTDDKRDLVDAREQVAAQCRAIEAASQKLDDLAGLQTLLAVMTGASEAAKHYDTKPSQLTDLLAAAA